jgi:hypothetical protein
MTFCIRMVFRRRAPTKIFGEIVISISVPMQNMRIIVRRVSVKYLRYKSMDRNLAPNMAFC